MKGCPALPSGGFLLSAINFLKIQARHPFPLQVDGCRFVSEAKDKARKEVWEQLTLFQSLFNYKQFSCNCLLT